MKRIMKLASLILILSLCLTSNAFAHNTLADTVVNDYYKGLNLSDVYMIETKEDRLEKVIASIDDSDGFSDDELKQISEVATVHVTTKKEDGITVIDYTFEPAEAIQVVTKKDGEKEFLNHVISYRIYEQEVGSTSLTKTIGTISLKGEMFYFYYYLESNRLIARVVRGECTVIYGAENMRNLQINTAAHGSAFDANGTQLSQHSMEETSNGTVYAKVSNSLYVQWSTVRNYYYLNGGEGFLRMKVLFQYKSGSSWYDGELGFTYNG